MAGKLSAATTTGDARQIKALCRHLEFFAEHPPLSVTPLSNGQLNYNYRVETQRGHYAVRCYPVSSSVACRQQELRCQHAAAVAGIAPAPLCLNNHQQVLISEFISGGAPYIFSEQGIPQLVGTLVKLHQIPAQMAVLQPQVYLQQLALRAGSALVKTELFNTLLDVAGQFQHLPADEVLCHLDLHAGNMLWADKALWLLDFEYARLADSFFDLAAISLNFNLSEHAEYRLLMAYCQLRNSGVVPSVELNRKLPMAKIVFSGFCWLWYLSLQDSQQDCLVQTRYWQQQLKQLLSLQAT